MTIAGFIAIAGVVVNRSLDADRPDPAEERKRERSEERVDDIEKRVRETRELIEDVGIVPGPNKGRGGGPGFVAPEDEVTRKQSGDPSKAKEDPPVVAGESATCRGERATVVGTAGNDVIRGTEGADIIAGLGGDDEIHGAGAGDFICGGDGVDHLYGDEGRDSLVGDAGDDFMDGGEGFDFIHFPGAPRDVNINFEHGFVEGEGDDDVVRVEAAEGTEFGDNFSGDGVPNLFSGRGGDDAMNGSGGADVFFPGPGNDIIAGHGGSDLVGFTSPNGRSGVEVNLSSNVATGEGVDRLNGIENISGTFQNDLISGDEQANSFYGGFGNDTLSGGTGSDALAGSAGNDTLDGGPGDDFLDGGSDQDTCANGEQEQGCETTGPLSSFAIWGLLGLVAGVLQVLPPGRALLVVAMRGVDDRQVLG